MYMGAGTERGVADHVRPSTGAPRRRQPRTLPASPIHLPLQEKCGSGELAPVVCRNRQGMSAREEALL